MIKSLTWHNEIYRMTLTRGAETIGWVAAFFDPPDSNSVAGYEAYFMSDPLRAIAKVQLAKEAQAALIADLSKSEAKRKHAAARRREREMPDEGTAGAGLALEPVEDVNGGTPPFADASDPGGATAPQPTVP